MDKKEFVLKAVADKKALIVDVSDKIFDYAEVGFHEFKTAKLYEEVLKRGMPGGDGSRRYADGVQGCIRKRKAGDRFPRRV